MNDIELAEYYFPHCMMHWPEKWREFAKEAKHSLKSEIGKKSLQELRNEYEKTLSGVAAPKEEAL